jgi:hypothetical protein
VRELARGVRNIDRPLLEALGVGKVNDHGVSGRPPLQRVDLGNRVRVRSVRAEPVHRLGRERDDLAGAQQLDGARDAPRRRAGRRSARAAPGAAAPRRLEV